MLVHSDVPAAVESHFVKSVAVVAVVALGVLNGKHRALDVVRKGSRDLMNGRFVAVADEVELAVVEGLTAHPILQEKSVLALVYVGNTVARALSASSAMLINDGVSVREPSLNALGKGIDDLVGIMSISEQSLTAEGQTQFGILQKCAQKAQGIPWVGIELAEAILGDVYCGIAFKILFAEAFDIIVRQIEHSF